jgi:hypothetical protein
MKRLFYYLWIPFFINSCGNARIEITSQYIINANWNEQANAIKLNQMKLKKDSVIDLSHLNQVDIVNRLEEDSSFRFYANVKIKQGESYRNKKIFFNKYNGFTWLNDVSGVDTPTLGDLQKGKWYKFSNLVTYPYFIYIYVDSLNNVHRFDVNLANY